MVRKKICLITAEKILLGVAKVLLEGVKLNFKKNHWGICKKNSKKLMETDRLPEWFFLHLQLKNVIVINPIKNQQKILMRI